jgi:MFS family permease
VITSVASLMVVLDALVVATALTAIRADLGASLVELEWTVNAYGLSFAVLLMAAAAAGDRWGRRRVFVTGVTVFAVASLVCAVAPNVATLVAGRVAQGVGAAFIMPLALALLGAIGCPVRRAASATSTGAAATPSATRLSPPPVLGLPHLVSAAHSLGSGVSSHRSHTASVAPGSPRSPARTSAPRAHRPSGPRASATHRPGDAKTFTGGPLSRA